MASVDVLKWRQLLIKFIENNTVNNFQIMCFFKILQWIFQKLFT